MLKIPLQVVAVGHLKRDQQVGMLRPHRKIYIERKCLDAIGGSNNHSSQVEAESWNVGWVKKNERGAYVGARKLWWRRKDTMKEDVREQIVDRFEKADEWKLQECWERMM